MILVQVVPVVQITQAAQEFLVAQVAIQVVPVVSVVQAVIFA